MNTDLGREIKAKAITKKIIDSEDDLIRTYRKEIKSHLKDFENTLMGMFAARPGYQRKIKFMITCIECDLSSWLGGVRTRRKKRYI